MKFNLNCKAWSVGDIYGSAPTLSTTWINEDCRNLNRVIAYAGSNEANGNVPQFISNFYIKCEAVRRMPMYSVPNCLGTRAFQRCFMIFKEGFNGSSIVCPLSLARQLIITSICFYCNRVIFKR